MQVVITSKNPIKIAAVEDTFLKAFKEDDVDIVSHEFSANIGNMPMTDMETLQGARDRTAKAIAEYDSADYWVSIEGGVDFVDGQMCTFGWVVIRNRLKEGRARTLSIFLPSIVTEKVLQGGELGPVMDEVFGSSNLKQTKGVAGILTKGIIDRKGMMRDAVACALAPFIMDDYYPVM